MDITTTEGRAALRAMLAEATPGPWSYSEKNEDDVQRPYRHGPQVVYADADCDIHPVADCSCNHTCRDEREAAANGIAIAAAINTLPALLDALEAAEASYDAALERVVALESQVENLSTLHRLEQERAVRAEARVARLTMPVTDEEGARMAHVHRMNGHSMIAALAEFIATRKERTI